MPTFQPTTPTTFYTVHNSRTGLTAARHATPHITCGPLSTNISLGHWFRSRPYEISDLITVIPSTTLATETRLHGGRVAVPFTVDVNGDIW